MKRFPIATLALLVGVAACQDAVTSPKIEATGDLQYALTSNPPPPPLDTGARGRFLPGANLRADEPTPRFFSPRFSIQQSLSAPPRATVLGLPRGLTNDIIIDAFDFFVPVQYDLDKRLLNGHVIFKKIKHSKAILKECHVDLHHGDELTGHATLKIQTEQGLLVIDCSSVLQPPTSYMERCGTEPDERCFHLVFGSAILYPPVGDPIEGTVEVITSCDPADVEEEEGSCPDFPDLD